MAFSYHYKWRHSFMKKMEKVIKLKLNLPTNYKLLSTILLGYDKLNDEDDEQCLLQNKKRKRFSNIKIFWKKKKYEQF